MKASKKSIKNKRADSGNNTPRQSKLTLEIAAALLEIKLIQEGKLKGLCLKDI